MMRVIEMQMLPTESFTIVLTYVKSSSIPQQHRDPWEGGRRCVCKSITSTEATSEITTDSMALIATGHDKSLLDAGTGLAVNRSGRPFAKDVPSTIELHGVSKP